MRARSGRSPARGHAPRGHLRLCPGERRGVCRRLSLARRPRGSGCCKPCLRGGKQPPLPQSLLRLQLRDLRAHGREQTLSPCEPSLDALSRLRDLGHRAPGLHTVGL